MMKVLEICGNCEKAENGRRVSGKKVLFCLNKPIPKENRHCRGVYDFEMVKTKGEICNTFKAMKDPRYLADGTINKHKWKRNTFPEMQAKTQKNLKQVVCANPKCNEKFRENDYSDCCNVKCEYEALGVGEYYKKRETGYSETQNAIKISS